MPEKQVYGDLNLNSNKVIGLAAAAASGQAVRYDEFNELVRKKGDTNLFLGKDSGNPSMSSTGNVLIGQDSGKVLTSANTLVAIGFKALDVGTTCYESVIIGANAVGVGVLTGCGNNILGYESGSIMTSGNENSIFGYKSGKLMTTGPRNVFLGANSGGAMVSGNNNVFIGYKSGFGLTGSDLFYLQNDNTDADVLMHGDFSAGQLAIGKSMALVAKLNVNGGIALLDLAADPVLTENGTGAFWISDGTGSGDAGDLMYSYRTGGSTTVKTVVDFA